VAVVTFFLDKEMNTWNTEVKELLNQFCHVAGATVEGFGRCFRPLHGFDQFLRHGGKEEPGNLLNLAPVGHRFNAGDDGDGDADFPGFFNEVAKIVETEEHLGDDEISTGIHFLFEKSQIFFQIGCFRVLFRIASHTNAEGHLSAQECFSCRDSEGQ